MALEKNSQYIVVLDVVDDAEFEQLAGVLGAMILHNDVPKIYTSNGWCTITIICPE